MIPRKKRAERKNAPKQENIKKKGKDPDDLKENKEHPLLPLYREEGCKTKNKKEGDHALKKKPPERGGKNKRRYRRRRGRRGIRGGNLFPEYYTLKAPIANYRATLNSVLRGGGCIIKSSITIRKSPIQLGGTTFFVICSAERGLPENTGEKKNKLYNPITFTIRVHGERQSLLSKALSPYL